MKYNKVMTDMLNAWYKDDRKFNNSYWYAETDEGIFLCIDGVMAINMPRCLFKLDMSIFDTPAISENMVKSLINGRTDAQEVFYKYEKPYEKDGKKLTIAVLDSIDSDGEIWINKNLLRYFDDKKCDLKFYATKPNYPVYIYEDGQYCGLVLPVYHK